MEYELRGPRAWQNGEGVGGEVVGGQVGRVAVDGAGSADLAGNRNAE